MTDSEKRIWVLGSPDHEMRAIERLLTDRSETIAYATIEDGPRRVLSSEAYEADYPVIRAASKAHWILVECKSPMRGGADVTVVDHHRPGDPGYGRQPADYWEASSIGQVCSILGVDPILDFRKVAAADHCLAAAYAGECPGVDPDALMQWRIEQHARFRGKSFEKVAADIKYAESKLKYATTISLAPGLDVLDVRRPYRVEDLPEVSARLGVACVSGRPGHKYICFGSADHVRAFMEQWGPQNGLERIYGDPARGFAGGYFPREKRERQ